MHNLLPRAVVLLTSILQGSAEFYTVLHRSGRRIVSSERGSPAAVSALLTEETLMKAWKTAALAAALVTAAGLGAALTPAARAQVRVRTQAPRALEVLTGGTRIG